MSVVANVAINVDSRGAVSNLRSVQNQAQSTEKAFSGVTAAASKLAIAFGGIQAAKFIFVKTAELESQTRSLQVLTGSAEKAGKIIKDLQKLGAVTPFTSTELIDSAKRLQAFGVQTEKVVETTRRLADASGATGAELSGLVTAYGQVQAKGRLQGEELLQFQERGIGLQEELGKMYGLTGEELQKALSKGRISAEAVEVAFIRLTEAGGKYAGGAIAQSDTLAGLISTLQDSVDELARQFGGALSQSVKDATKLLIGFVNGISSIPQPVIQAAAELAKFIAQMVLVQKIIQIIIGLRAAYVSAMIGMAGATTTAGAAATTSAGAFALYTNNARALQAASIAATGSVSGLAGALLGLAGIGIITVGVNYVVTQVGAISGNISSINASEAAGTSGGLAAQLKGKSAAERKKMMAAAQKNLANDQKLVQRLQLQTKAQEAASTDKPDPSQRTELLAAQARIKTNQARIRAIQSTPLTAGAPPNKPLAVPDLLAEAPTKGATGRGGKKGKTDAERAAEEAAQVEKQTQERLRGLIREVELIDQIATIKELQFQAEMNGNKELQIRLQGEERIIQIMQSTAQALDGITDERLKQNILAKAESEIASSRQETLFEMQRIDNERTKSFNEIIAGLDLELALKTATTEQAREQLRLEAEIAKLRGQGFTPEEIGAITAKKTELAKPKTDRERLQAEAGAVKEELAKLTDPVNMITTAAAGIGDAFSTSFKGIISGSMTAKEALANFFTSLADMFLDMAAQIITKMITMAILNAVLGVLPGGGGGAGGGLASGFSAGTASAIPTDAGGWAQSFATVLPGRAKGGPVSSGQTYMVGERGPELFVPGRSGTIVANDKMGGGNTNVVVNVDAKGSSVEGDEQGANQLGRVISAAVQSELIKQQRPGGILAR